MKRAKRLTQTALTQQNYFKAPLRRAAQKVGEEGVETALAAVAETEDKLTSEAADLLYHLIVLLRAKDVSLDDVISVLRERHK